MKEKLYVCDHRNICNSTSCGGQRPNKLKFTWGVDKHFDYKGILCGDVHDVIRPIPYYEIPKLEIDKLFSWE